MDNFSSTIMRMSNVIKELRKEILEKEESIQRLSARVVEQGTVQQKNTRDWKQSYDHIKHENQQLILKNEELYAQVKDAEAMTVASQYIQNKLDEMQAENDRLQSHNHLVNKSLVTQQSETKQWKVKYDRLLEQYQSESKQWLRAKTRLMEENTRLRQEIDNDTNANRLASTKSPTMKVQHRILPFDNQNISKNSAFEPLPAIRPEVVSNSVQQQFTSVNNSTDLDSRRNSTSSNRTSSNGSGNGTLKVSQEPSMSSKRRVDDSSSARVASSHDKKPSKMSLLDGSGRDKKKIPESDTGIDDDDNDAFVAAADDDDGIGATNTDDGDAAGDYDDGGDGVDDIAAIIAETAKMSAILENLQNQKERPDSNDSSSSSNNSSSSSNSSSSASSAIESAKPTKKNIVPDAKSSSEENNISRGDIKAAREEPKSTLVAAATPGKASQKKKIMVDDSEIDDDDSSSKSTLKGDNDNNHASSDIEAKHELFSVAKLDSFKIFTGANIDNDELLESAEGDYEIFTGHNMETFQLFCGGKIDTEVATDEIDSTNNDNEIFTGSKIDTFEIFSGANVDSIVGVYNTGNISENNINRDGDIKEHDSQSIDKNSVDSGEDIDSNGNDVSNIGELGRRADTGINGDESGTSSLHDDDEINSGGDISLNGSSGAGLDTSSGLNINSMDGDKKVGVADDMSVTESSFNSDDLPQPNPDKSNVTQTGF